MIKAITFDLDQTLIDFMSFKKESIRVKDELGLNMPFPASPKESAGKAVDTGHC